jgi:hypothetical protein
MDVRKMARMGQKAMRERQSTAEKVFWPLQAGRPRQIKPGLLEAVHLGRTAANRFYDSVKEAGLRLKENNAGCFLLCATMAGKIGALYFFHVDNQDASDLEMALKILNAKEQPAGLAFFLKDLEKGKQLSYARPFGPEYAPLMETLGWDVAALSKR